jgi:hypothetical protein
VGVYVLDISCLMSDCVMWVSVCVGYVMFDGRVCHVGWCVYRACHIS